MLLPPESVFPNQTFPWRSTIGKPAVAITVTGPIEPLAHTLQDKQSPRRGGYQIARLINNTPGFGLNTPTLGFNATRGGVPGFVTNSHNTQVFWNLDTIRMEDFLRPTSFSRCSYVDAHGHPHHRRHLPGRTVYFNPDPHRDKKRRTSHPLIERTGKGCSTAMIRT